MQTKKSSIGTSIYLTNRTAIDSRGRVGSLYDAYQDRLIGQLNITDQDKLYQSQKLLRCGIVHGNSDRNQNLLRLLSIDEQLRLSILLKLVPSQGIASIIDYPYRTNKHTRLLCYSYVDRIQRLPGRMEDARQFINSSISPTKATHIITSVEWGIDLVVVLQLPLDTDTRKDIDGVLKRMHTCLYCNYNTSSLVSDEESLLQKIIHIKVYSNTPDLCNMTTLYDICRYIEQNKNSTTNNPILYNLRPIQWLYPQYTGIFISLSPEFNDNIEQYVFHLTADIKILETFLNENMPNLLSEHFKEQLSRIQKQWIDVKNKYTIEIDRVSKLVIDIRSGRVQEMKIDQAFQNHEEIIMKNCVRGLTQTLEYLEEKTHFISDLNRQQIQYYNITELNIDQTDNIKTIEHKLITDDECDRVLCSSDTLNKNYPIQLNKLCCDLVDELKNNPDLRLFYADFSYSSFELHNMMMLPSNKYNNETNRPKQKAISTSTKTHLPIAPPPPTNEIINVLLLGETGVGKSTFINAFANYLKFETLKQAQSETPIALIPVSFLITVDNNLDKRTVKFGDFVSSNNEDFDHPGQSVTQDCRSYVFHIGHGNGRKLRIIDTPGFGDTRGPDQDELNMQHILEYINNLSHLNAICFLLKSNALHLHTFFQSCLSQLFSFLQQTARNNIAFCFTNGRSNFYMPGNTTPLLKNMLTSFSEGEIPFEEENTFCFDNEPFRYLVALQNRIPFGDHEKEDYEMSWSTSMTELKRFIDYIGNNLVTYRIRQDIQSIRHAQFEIVRIIRPMLETMRNILRNTVLWNMDSPNRSIELRPKVSNRLAKVCLLCKLLPHQIGNFWIGNRSLHETGNGCRTCSCPANQHIQIDYVIEYDYLNNSSKYNRNQMKILLDQLCHASVKFCDFLTHIACSIKDDPFLTGLVKMTAEENYLSENLKPNYLNLQLVNDLKQLQNKYQQRKSQIVHNQGDSNLSDIYTLINTVREYPMVREQVAAAKEGRKMMMKQHEFEVPQHLRSTLVYSAVTHRNSSNT
jgi:GTP-binding protein EngB required for normal cell division